MVNKKLIVALQVKCASRGSHKGRNRDARGWASGAVVGAGSIYGAASAARTGAGYPTLVDTKGGVDPEPPIHYYWTWGPGCRHTSVKCPKPEASHIYTVTKRDIQGGVESP